MTRVLGIDPGLATTGYAVVEEIKGKTQIISSGLIKTSKHLAFEQRYFMLFQEILKLIKNYKPCALSLETLIFNKNSKTAFEVGRACGVVVLAAGCERIPVYEYSPSQIKLALTGWGKADKIQIQKMIKMIFAIKEPFKSDDEADALAIALCHLQNAKIKQKIKVAK